MIRLLIAGLMVLMAGNAYATDTERLYFACKAYADSGFQIDASSNNNLLSQSLYCVTYMSAVRDSGQFNCLVAKEHEEKFLKDIVATTGIGLTERNNLFAVIQSFLNEAKANPESWKKNPIGEVLLTWKKFQPCKPE